MTSRPPHRALFFAIVATIVVAAGGYVWHRAQQTVFPTGFAQGQGRLEAAEFALTTPLPGRLSELLVNEGDSVQAGQVLAHVDAQRPNSDPADTALKAQRSGRVSAQRAAPGDMLPPEGAVLTLMDPSELLVSLSLPESVASKVAIGADVRLVLDQRPNYVVPAQISSVEAAAAAAEKEHGAGATRREATFGSKARINRDLLDKYRTQLTHGLPGRAYVRLDPAAQWPAHLQVRLPR